MQATTIGKKQIRRLFLIIIGVLVSVVAVSICRLIFIKYTSITYIKALIKTTEGGVSVEYRDSIWLAVCSSDTLESFDERLGWPLFGHIHRVDLGLVNAQAMTAVSHLSTIRELSLWGECTCSTESFLRLKNLRNLSLFVANCQGSVEGDRIFELATSWPKLQVLYLTIPQTSDAGLAHCRNMPSLSYVILHGEHISDEGIRGLVACSTLRRIDVKASVHVSNATIEYLKQTNPELTLNIWSD